MHIIYAVIYVDTVRVEVSTIEEEVLDRCVVGAAWVNCKKGEEFVVRREIRYMSFANVHTRHYLAFSL